MTATNLPLKSTLLTAAAALLCTGLQFAGIDSLAAPRSFAAEAQVVQLPLVVVVGRQLDRATATVQAQEDSVGTAI